MLHKIFKRIELFVTQKLLICFKTAPQCKHTKKTQINKNFIRKSQFAIASFFQIFGEFVALKRAVG